MIDVLLWIATVLLVAIFTGSGAAKATMSRERMLATGQTGIAPFPTTVVRVVAGCELLAAVGLLAPWLSGTARVLTPLAALGLTAVMYGAAVSHASLREPKQVAINLALLLVCVGVAVGRWAQLA